MLRVALLVLAIAGGTAARGAPAVVDEATRARYAAAAQEERDLAARVRDEPAQLAGDYARYEGFFRDDLGHYKDAAGAEAAIHDQIATAYDHSDAAEVDRLRKEADSAAKVKLVWRERIAEWRVRQGTAAPSEHWYRDESRWLGAGARGDLDAFAEARKAAAEAWGRVAEACVPGRDAAALNRLKDDAYRADAEREIAEMRYNWARQREQIWQNKKVTSDELTRRLAELEKLQDQRIALRREEIDRDRRTREVDGQIRHAEKSFRESYDKAQKDAQDRARSKAAKR
ncbi:MAG TPA: hypothetical protein VH475_03560 [Tepidisphaeraceae bacterium]|jgi:hypothetical protein